VDVEAPSGSGDDQICTNCCQNRDSHACQRLLSKTLKTEQCFLFETRTSELAVEDVNSYKGDLLGIFLTPWFCGKSIKAGALVNSH
jgi:hypothetical protein